MPNWASSLPSQWRAISYNERQPEVPVAICCSASQIAFQNESNSGPANCCNWFWISARTCSASAIHRSTRTLATIKHMITAATLPACRLNLASFSSGDEEGDPVA